MMLFLTTSLVSLTVVLCLTLTQVNADPDPPVCNAADANWATTIHYSRRTAQWIPAAPNGGACGAKFNYRDTTNGVCVHSSWTQKNGCGRWIKITNSANQVSVDAQIRDSCGDQDNTFTCDDLKLSRNIFGSLAGAAGTDQNALIDAGNIEGLSWTFQDAPCWACAAGIPYSLKTDGTKDDCKGPDFNQFARCGYKHGADRITGPEAAKVCNKDYQCPA